jgi:hypothetical protein
MNDYYSINFKKLKNKTIFLTTLVSCMQTSLMHHLYVIAHVKKARHVV